MKYETEEDINRHAREVLAALSRSGKRQGNLHAVNGTGVCGRTPEQMLLDGQKGGLIGGPIAAKHPNSKAALKALTQDRDHQRYASHCSNHVRLGRPKISCEFCSEESLVIAFG